MLRHTSVVSVFRQAGLELAMPGQLPQIGRLVFSSGAVEECQGRPATVPVEGEARHKVHPSVVEIAHRVVEVFGQSIRVLRPAAVTLNTIRESRHLHQPQTGVEFGDGFLSWAYICQAIAACRMLEMQAAPWAAVMPRERAGSNNAARTAMMAITTSSSTSVKPRGRRRAATICP